MHQLAHGHACNAKLAANCVRFLARHGTEQRGALAIRQRINR
jgi:hypothetical protein